METKKTTQERLRDLQEEERLRDLQEEERLRDLQKEIKVLGELQKELHNIAFPEAFPTFQPLPIENPNNNVKTGQVIEIDAEEEKKDKIPSNRLSLLIVTSSVGLLLGSTTGLIMLGLYCNGLMEIPMPAEQFFPIIIVIPAIILAVSAGGIVAAHISKSN